MRLTNSVSVPPLAGTQTFWKVSIAVRIAWREEVSLFTGQIKSEAGRVFKKYFQKKRSPIFRGSRFNHSPNRQAKVPSSAAARFASQAGTAHLSCG